MEASMAENNGSRKAVILFDDVQHTIDGYMNDRSKEIFDLIKKHPNKTWTEITSSFVDSQPLTFSVITSNGFAIPIIISIAGVIVSVVIILLIRIVPKRRRTSYENIETESYQPIGISNNDL